MTAQTSQVATNPVNATPTQTPGVSVNQGVLAVATCTECDASIPANVALPGEILD
ncbi:MAG: hypothetical protein QOC71_1188, partial [Thermoplasmata archaeon]|nr:hypothetical protein [Thermoplasmata archaeon]